MALKGFLASGFQKLIGASRISGANNQWLGEYNKVTYNSATTPISTIIPVFGFNYLEWLPPSGAFIGDSTALFSTNPTTGVVITIRNASASNSIIINNAGSVAGSLVGNGSVYLRYDESITYIYDVAAVRWREISRSTEYRVFATTVSGTAIQAGAARMQSLEISASADYTVTTITPASGAQPGDVVNLLVGAISNPITLQQDTTGALSNGLIMNGDYAMTRYSAISFRYNGIVWIEQSRNMIGGY